MASAIKSYIVLCAVGLVPCREVAPASLQVDLPTLLVDKRRGGCQSVLVRFFKDCGYRVVTTSRELDEGILREIDAIVLDVGLHATPYTEAELKGIEKFHHGGGSILILGQGWAFVHYGKGSEAQYPPNMLKGLTGIHVTQQYAGSPARIVDHAVTKGLDRISYGQGVASVLKLSGRARAIASDKAGNVVMAASEGKGKTIHVGHVPYRDLGPLPTTDVPKLLRNALHWLAPPVTLTDEEIRSQLSQMGDLAWLRAEPEKPHIRWVSLDGVLVRIDRTNGEYEKLTEILGQRANVTSLAFAAGLMWVGTMKGLVAYDSHTRSWSRYAINADYDLMDAEVRRIEGRENPARLTVQVITADGERTFTYNLASKRWRD